MPIWCCTECGCEAAASSVEMVVSMGWLVEPPGPVEDKIAALCAQCRSYKRGPLRAPSMRSSIPPVEGEDGVAVLRGGVAHQPRRPPRS
jgi:hypothetical protein